MAKHSARERQRPLDSQLSLVPYQSIRDDKTPEPIFSKGEFTGLTDRFLDTRSEFLYINLIATAGRYNIPDIADTTARIGRRHDILRLAV